LEKGESNMRKMMKIRNPSPLEELYQKKVRRGLNNTEYDAHTLADIFIDETNKYYKGHAIQFQVIFVAAEIIIDIALRAVPANVDSSGIMYDHMRTLDIIERKWDPPPQFVRRRCTNQNKQQRGINDAILEDARKLADIFIDEANKYYNSDAIIPFQVICVAAEFIIDNVLKTVPANWGSRVVMSDHISALHILRR
jgi:succinyl-CoA synthetase alpha subunit